MSLTRPALAVAAVLLVAGGAYVATMPTDPAWPVSTASVALAPATRPDDQDCDDFDSQQEAQDHLNADQSDPDGLDANDNGEACESHDYTGSVPADPDYVPQVDDGGKFDPDQPAK